MISGPVETTLPSGNWAQDVRRPKFRAKKAARDARRSDRGSRVKLPDLLTLRRTPHVNLLSRQTLSAADRKTACEVHPE